MKKIWKRALSLALAVVMVVGMITVTSPKEAEAAEQARTVAFEFQGMEGDLGWRFGHTSLPAAYQGQDDWSAVLSYEFDAYKDGSDAPEKVRIEFVGSTAYIWGELHYTDKVLPTTSLYVPEGTIMYECTYDEGAHKNNLVADGKQLVLSEELKMIYKDDTWVQNKIEGVTVSFRGFDDSMNWIFDHSALPVEYQGTGDWSQEEGVTVRYQFQAYVDDSTELQAGWLEMEGATMYIYSGAFPGAEAPTSKFHIPIDSVLEEYDPDQGELVEEGKRIRMKSDCIMTVDANGEWTQQQASDTQYDLVSDGVTDYKILLPAEPTANEQYAADELQYFIKEATGVRMLFHREGSGELPEKFISVGDTQASREAGITPTYEELKSNGFVIQTIEDDCYIKGYGDMGTRNGAYEWLSYCFDYECYTPDAIQLTKTESRKLPLIQVTRVPDFEYREASSETALDAQGAYRMQYNSSEEIFVTGHSCHNTYTIIDPETDYPYTDAKYKNWYSTTMASHNQRGGRNLPAQLCFSNEEVKAEFLKNLKAFLADNRNGQPSMMIGMEDNNYWCTCSACTASKNQYGTNSATMIKFINYLQEEINAWYAAEYPGEEPVQLVMFAYHQSEEPPVVWDDTLGDYVPMDESVRLHDDVGVMYAPIRASYAYSIEDPINQKFKRQVEGWDALTTELYMWTYAIYTENMTLFMDTFHIIQDNYEFFKNCGAKFMVDMLGSYNHNGNGGWERAKNYVMSRLMWDIDQDIDMLLNDFFAFYFEDASDIMKNLMEENSQYIKDNVWTKLEYVEPTDSNYTSVQGNIFVQIPNHGGKDIYFTEDYLRGALDQIDNAYAAIEKYKFSDPDKYWELYQRINLESMQFRYILIRWHIDPTYWGDHPSEEKWEFRRDYDELGIIGVTDHYTPASLFGDIWQMPREDGELVYNSVNITYADIASDGKIYLQGEIVSGPNKGSTLASIYGNATSGSGKISYYMDGKTITEKNTWTVTNADSTHGNSTICVEPTSHLSSNIADVSNIMLKKGEIIVVGEKLPFQILNDVNVWNAGDTWAEYNDVELTYTKTANNGQVHLNAQIISGPDIGSTIGEVYGDWEAAASGNITYTIDGSVKKDQTAYFDLYVDNPYDYNANMLLRNDGFMAGYQDDNVTQLIIKEGTMLAVANNRALRVASELKLERNPGEDWAREFNVVQISYDTHNYVYETDEDGNPTDEIKAVGFYLNAEIVEGPDAGKPIQAVYGSWAEPTPIGAMTYTGSDESGEKFVAYSICENNGLSQIYISGNYSPDKLEKVSFVKGTLVVPTRLESSRTPFLLANNLSIVATEDGFLAENQVSLTYDRFDGRGFYLKAKITAGPDKGANIADVYGDWANSPCGEAIVYRNGEPQELDVIWSPCTDSGEANRIYISGDYAEYMNEVTEIKLAEDTVITPNNADYCGNPIRLTQELRLVNRQVATNDDENNTFFDTSMLDIMVQDTYETADIGATAYDMRFIGSVDELEYRRAGFVFSLRNENPTKDGEKCVYKEVGKVYERLSGGSIGGRVGVSTLYPNSNSQYLYAFEITGVPANTVIYVRAYVELYDGTIVYGTTRAVPAPAVKPAT